MVGKRSGSGGAGLERSCDEPSADWIRATEAIGGVELIEAWFQGHAYRKHRTPGRVVVLHPDEPHDGHAGGDGGFGYRLLYVEPALIFEAVQVLCGQRCTLPFVRQPVVTNTNLSAAIRAAFQGNREPLATDDLVLRLAEGMLAADPRSNPTPIMRHLDVVAIERARQFFDAEKTRVVRSWDLEAVTGLSRYELARQFRLVVGTSPYRYSLMRRLVFARTQLSRQRALVDIPLEAGFADQGHFTRMFTAAFGITPARYIALRVRETT